MSHTDATIGHVGGVEASPFSIPSKKLVMWLFIISDAVTFGAILLVCGHAGMTLEGSGARQILSFRGVDYELATTGRSGDAARIVVSPRGVSKVEIEEGRIRVENPQAVGLPPLIPLSDASIDAVDISSAALAVCRRNVRRLKLGRRVRVRSSDHFSALGGR